MQYDETLEECTAFRSSKRKRWADSHVLAEFSDAYIFFLYLWIYVMNLLVFYSCAAWWTESVFFELCFFQGAPHLVSGPVGFCCFRKSIRLGVSETRRPLNPMMYQHLPYETWIYKWLSMGVRPICRHTHLSKWYVFKWKVKESQ